MFVFDHVGITTTVPQPDENWVEQSRVWVTNPRNHPEHIEFLRYEPGTTVPDAVRNNPAFSQSLMFSTRMGVSEPSAAGTRTFVLSGTAWENGARIPVTARCVVGPGSTVASVARINDASTIANAAH